MGILQKIKKEVKNFGESADIKLDYVLDNKHERTENCFNSLKTNNIDICFKHNGVKIVEYTQIEHIGIGRTDMIDSIVDYCINEFEARDIVKCDSLYGTEL